MCVAHACMHLLFLDLHHPDPLPLLLLSHGRLLLPLSLQLPLSLRHDLRLEADDLGVKTQLFQLHNPGRRVDG